MSSPVQWALRPADETQVERLTLALGVPRVFARLLWLRGFRKPQDARAFLESRHDLSWLHQPLMTPGMERGVARIRKAIAEQEPFIVYGDYDCDGVTSASVLYRYLKRGLGAQCEAYLPDRFKDGYGVTPQAVERIAASGVRLILTCDNGISAVAAADTARRLGVDLVVTDHHQAPEQLPDVFAVIHPAVGFPHLKDLAGVGVALLFVIALEGSFSPRLAHFLDLASIGTVGDVVPLNGPNRALVWGGLERFRNQQHRFPGLRALAEVAGTDLARVRAEDLAFQLVPRLNAAGRLENPRVGFELLTTNDLAEARQLAEMLDRINRQRREMSGDLQVAVETRLQREWDFEAEPFVVLADSQFHHGITGIIAGRIKERYRCPVLLFSGQPGGLWKASGRSPEGLHLYEALHAVRAHLKGFGGHAQAAGCVAEEGQLSELRRALNQHVRSVGWRPAPDRVWLDAELPFAQANSALLDALDGLEPFGQRNPAPVFGLRRARVVGQRIHKTHLFLEIDDGENVAEVVAWNRAQDAAQLGAEVQLTYRIRYNTFRGKTSLQFVADRLQAIATPSVIQAGAAQSAESR